VLLGFPATALTSTFPIGEPPSSFAKTTPRRVAAAWTLDATTTKMARMINVRADMVLYGAIGKVSVSSLALETIFEWSCFVDTIAVCNGLCNGSVHAETV
jgi:hypothetical protein